MPEVVPGSGLTTVRDVSAGVLIVLMGSEPMWGQKGK